MRCLMFERLNRAVAQFLMLAWFFTFLACSLLVYVLHFLPRVGIFGLVEFDTELSFTLLVLLLSNNVITFILLVIEGYKNDKISESAEH